MEDRNGNNIVVHPDMMGSEATEEDVDRFVAALRENGYTWASSAIATGSPEGDASGITDYEWNRIMNETFN